jgi:RNA ligase-like protein
MDKIKKYPRTQHLQGSRLQKGDHDLEQVAFSSLRGKHVIIEEKVDGANAGVSFDESGNVLLQSRGHYLTGGPREKHWTLFKQWAAVHEDSLFDILGNRYVLYGEWMFAKHTVFYDLLPHYLMEFDVYDRENDVYLSTEARRSLLGSSPVRSVLVIHEGQIDDLEDLRSLVTHSYFKSGLWTKRLAEQAERANVDPELAKRQTDPLDTMEGLYIKVEGDGIVQERLKWVRHTFLNSIMDSETHWLDRPIIQNMLAPGVDIFRR